MKTEKKQILQGPAVAVPVARPEGPAIAVPTTQIEGPAIAVPTTQIEGPAIAVPTTRTEGPAIAVPSWSIPGTVAENARFLVGKTDEVGLCFFEAEASANMPEEELPRELSALPFRWHIHLPVDLDADSGANAAEACLRVWKRAAFLRPWIGVLHLASLRQEWLRDFLAVWRHAGLGPEMLALENVEGVAPWRCLSGSEGAGLCLDVAHAMAYGQMDILDFPAWLARVKIVHWSAPGGLAADGTPEDRHLPLTAWSEEQRRLAGAVARKLPPDAVHLVEVFSWAGVEESLPILRDLLRKR